LKVGAISADLFLGSVTKHL